MRRRLSPAFWLGLVGLVAILLVPSAAFAAGAAAEPDAMAGYHGWGLLALYGTAFTAGLAASLTPCVYPMIPIVLGVFGARGKDVSRRKSLVLATLYVFGMGVTYATLGTIFTLLGKQFSAVLAEPVVVIPIVALYVVLAVSMFGAFDLNLPASWQNKLNKVGGAGYGGAFAMGLVGGFTAAPCTGPFVAGLLTAVAKTGDVAIGASTLFVHAIGIGVLYWVLAVFAGRMPKSGQWMEWVKSIGGIGLIVAALWFLRPIVAPLREFGSPSTVFLIVAIGLAVVGLALGAVHLSFHDSAKVRARKGVAVAMAVAGGFGIATWLVTPDRILPWEHDEARAYAKARAEHKGIMVDFSATWCVPCQKLETTFGEDGVYETLVDNFVPLKIDVSVDDAASQAKKARFQMNQSLPTVLFFAYDGDELVRIGKVDEETPDYLKAEGFLKVAGPAAEEIRKRRPVAAATP